MKQISIVLLAILFSATAWAQDVQDVSKQILRLAAQRDYNNSLILDLNRKALDIDNEIRRLQVELQKLLDAQKAEAPSK